MKRVAMFLALIGCTPAAPDTTAVRAITEPGLVAAWGFDEAGGTSAADATCNGHTATLSGQTHVIGKFGNALAYSGNFATVADATDLHLSTAATLEAWVYPTSLPSGQFACVLMKERSGELTYDIYANSNVNKPEFDYTSGSTPTEHNLTGGSKLTLNTWTHLAATFDGTTMRLYVNGVQKSSKSSAGTIYPSTGQLSFGGNTVWNEYFTGRIDEVRIYNRVLAASEILTNKDQAIGSVSCGGTGGAGGSGGSGGASGSGGTGGRAGSAGSAGSADAGTDSGSDAAAGSGGSSGGGGSAGAGGSAGSGGTAGTGSIYPLKLASGKRYLVDQNNRPFMIIGDAAWSLAVSISSTDADTYLADRQARGYNSVIVNLIEHKFVPTPPGPPKNAAGDLPFTGTLPSGDLDFTTPNEAYFAHVDDVLNLAAARGIQVLMFPDYLGYQGGDEGWYTELLANGTTRLATYGTYVGNRYKSFPNILWVAGADYNSPHPELVDAVHSAIAAVDHNHLHTAHTDSGSSPKDVYGAYSWLTVNDIYGYPALNQFPYDMAETQYTRSDWQPLFLIESTYEHNTWTASPPLLIRHQAYESLLSGCFGEFSGNEWLWPFGGPDISGAVHAWQPQLASQGAADMSRLAALFTTRHWETLVPDFDHVFVTAGYTPGSDRATSSYSTDGKLGIAYMPTVRSITVDMTKMAGSTTARWYDPTSGAFTTVSGSPFANSGTHVFNPGGNNSGGDADWALVLEN